MAAIVGAIASGIGAIASPIAQIIDTPKITAAQEQIAQTNAQAAETMAALNLKGAQASSGLGGGSSNTLLIMVAVLAIAGIGLVLYMRRNLATQVPVTA